MTDEHRYFRTQPGIMHRAGIKGAIPCGRGLKCESSLAEREPLGPSDVAIKRFRERPYDCIVTVSDHTALRQAIAAGARVRTPIASFVGAGSDEVIAFLAKRFRARGSEVLQQVHGFGMYP